jgi:hypothetical protein
MSDAKKRRFTVRWQEEDFVFIEKDAKRQKITKSEYLRRLVQKEKEKYDRQTERNQRG